MFRRELQEIGGGGGQSTEVLISIKIQQVYLVLMDILECSFSVKLTMVSNFSMIALNSQIYNLLMF